MSAYPLCVVDNCKNKRSDEPRIPYHDPRPDYSGLCVTHVVECQKRDGENRIKWAREDRRHEMVGRVFGFIFFGIPALLVATAVILWAWRTVFGT